MNTENIESLNNDRLNFFIQFFKERPNVYELEISQDEFDKLAEELQAKQRFFDSSDVTPIYSISLHIEQNRLCRITPLYSVWREQL